VSTAFNTSLSVEEFLRRPECHDGQREELIEGEVILSPSAKAWHTDIVRRLRVKLALLEDRGYALINDSSCVLGKRSMPAPDLAAVTSDRWQQAVAGDGWLQGSPELVIEVASPGNRNLRRKAGLYLQYGAEQVWIVYRKTQTVVVMTQEGAKEARLSEYLEFHGCRVAIVEIL
jgi:Uma2 family endonuclease